MKVLDFVKSGGPKGTVDGTVFEIWLDSQRTQAPCTTIVVQPGDDMQGSEEEALQLPRSI